MATIEFDRERAIEHDEAQPGQTLLELARAAGIPHAAACGGKGRCSTCRVVVLDHPENLAPPSDLEAALALKKGFDPNIRLACQAVVRGPVRVRRLVLDDEDIQLAVKGNAQTAGKERHLAILFSDIRDFTPFAESHLPYDVIHILGRYFKQGRRAGAAPRRLHRQVHGRRHHGDLRPRASERPPRPVIDAVAAAIGMQESLREFNVYIKSQFDTEFKIGIGVHFGPVIVGEMGHPEKMHFTAIGDTVNIASRIESATKALGAPILVSHAVRQQLGDAVRFGASEQVNLKGKTGPTLVHQVLGLADAPSGDQAAP
jgi:adenylate cyclase